VSGRSILHRAPKYLGISFWIGASLVLLIVLLGSQMGQVSYPWDIQPPAILGEGSRVDIKTIINRAYITKCPGKKMLK
jgi:hypothetical protein